MADKLFARITHAVQNLSRMHREQEVSSRIRAVEAAVREAKCPRAFVPWRLLFVKLVASAAK